MTSQRDVTNDIIIDDVTDDVLRLVYSSVGVGVTYGPITDGRDRGRPVGA